MNFAFSQFKYEAYKNQIALIKRNVTQHLTVNNLKQVCDYIINGRTYPLEDTTFLLISYALACKFALDPETIISKDKVVEENPAIGLYSVGTIRGMLIVACNSLLDHEMYFVDGINRDIIKFDYEHQEELNYE